MQDIEAILTTLLRQPPAEAGMRLRSDRELAALCGVNSSDRQKNPSRMHSSNFISSFLSHDGRAHVTVEDIQARCEATASAQVNRLKKAQQQRKAK